MNFSRKFQIDPSKQITICCCDCLDGMKQLNPGSVSAIVTSPPYNLGIAYGSYDDTISRDEYLRWIDQWAMTASSVLAPDGSLFLNVGSAPSDPFIAMDVARQVSQHLTLQNVIHWIKAISIDKSYLQNVAAGADTVNYGHFKPINSQRFVNDCQEFIFHFTHSGKVTLDRKAIGVPYTHKSNISRWKSSSGDVRCRGNTWFIPYKTITSSQKQRPHPATFPEELAARCIQLHGIDRVSMVLDPFMGIGTTAIACARLKLSCIGYELDPGYYAECNQRLELHFTTPNKQTELFGDLTSEISDLRTR